MKSLRPQGLLLLAALAAFGASTFSFWGSAFFAAPSVPARNQWGGEPADGVHPPLPGPDSISAPTEQADETAWGPNPFLSAAERRAVGAESAAFSGAAAAPTVSRRPRERTDAPPSAVRAVIRIDGSEIVLRDSKEKR